MRGTRREVRTLTIQVTDAAGAPLSDTTVTTITGVVSREGVTAADGSLRMVNMRPGTYRLQFVREGSITLERELTLRAGESLTIDVSLSAAPPPPKAPEPVAPPPAPTALGPPGEPRVIPVPLFLEKNFIGGREGRKESVLGCTSTGTATLYQLREAWPAHTHDEPRNGSMSSPAKACFALERPSRKSRRAPSASFRTRCLMP